MVRVLGLFEGFLKLSFLQVSVLLFLILISNCLRSGYSLLYIDTSGHVARDLVFLAIGYLFSNGDLGLSIRLYAG